MSFELFDAVMKNFQSEGAVGFVVEVHGGKYVTIQWTHPVMKREMFHEDELIHYEDAWFSPLKR